ncbi:MAG: SDR family oxidoreductase [Bdellovibrionaceae bacterium]|nr:SDR family oxidoreductase [Pseudobdellovibrionaceae bacterium]
MKIFITGATGFLGSSLIQDLLANGHQVTALVRSKNGRCALKQLIDSLPEQNGAFLHDRAADQSLQMIEGDVAGERFGLGESTYARLAKNSDFIFHNAACTKLETDWDIYEKINIGGTREAIKFAAHTPHKMLAHVSSAYVAGNRTQTVREDELDLQAGFRNGYEKSKAISETAVRQAAASGKIRTMILRPGIIIADSTNGKMNEGHHLFDFVFRMFWARQMIQKRHASSASGPGDEFRLLGNPEATKNLIPVNHVAKSIAALIETDKAWGGSFHLTHPEPITLHKLLAYVKKSMDWPNINFISREIHRKFTPLEQRFFNGVKVYDKYFWQEPVFDQSQLKAALGGNLQPPAPVCQDSVKRIVDFVRMKYSERTAQKKNGSLRPALELS